MSTPKDEPMEPIEPLDDVLGPLMRAERRAPGPRPGTDARVRQAVLATVATTAATSAAAASAATSAPTAAAASGIAAPGVATGIGGVISSGGTGLALAAAVAATAGGTFLVSSYELPEHDPPPAVVKVLETAPVASPPAGLVVESTTTIPKSRPQKEPKRVDAALAAPADTAAKTASTPAFEAALAAERAVIAEAREALRRDDGHKALIALQAHRDTFPSGQLLEEREALTVMALSSARQRGPAASAATRFMARYPTSIFLDAVNRAVEGGGR